MTPRARDWLAVAALCAVVLLVYANSFESGFVLDNRILILADSRVHHATPENLALIFNHTYWWPAGESGLYRPITTLSWLFNYAILGNADRPAGYHWINLLLHAANVLLLFALARRLLRGLFPAFLTAAVWAVHPVLTESVTNIVGRADLLAGLTVLGGLLLHLKSTETAGWRRAAWLTGLLALTLLGVFSKESAVAVLGVIGLYELTWLNRRRLRGFTLSCLAMLPAFLAMLSLRSRVLAASAPSLFPFVDNPIVGAGFWTGRLTALKVVAKYLGLMVWPAHLSADYSYPQIPLADGRLSDWLAWLVVAIVAAGIVLSYRRSKVAFFAAGFSLITFLPASNLLIPMGTIMAERLLYLPAIGFSICLTLALYSLSQRLHQPAIAAVLLCLIAVGLGARTHVRNADWKDDLTFWSVAVQTAPRSFKSHTVLAEVLDLDHSDPEREMQEDERGLALLDSIPDSLNLARTYFRVAVHCVGIGDRLVQRAPDGKLIIPPESVSKYERAKSLLLHSLAILQANRKAEAGKPPSGIWGMRGNPGLITTDADVQNWLLLSKTDQRLGQNDEALQATREAQELGPLHPEVYLRMHEILLETGRKDEALTALLEGALLTSDGPLLQKLVAAYSDNPDETKCAISYEKVVPQIDFSCTLVRKRVCSISGDLIRIRLKTAGAEAAMRFKKELAAKYGCP